MTTKGACREARGKHAPKEEVAHDTKCMSCGTLEGYIQKCKWSNPFGRESLSNATYCLHFSLFTRTCSNTNLTEGPLAQRRVARIVTYAPFSGSNPSTLQNMSHSIIESTRHPGSAHPNRNGITNNTQPEEAPRAQERQEERERLGVVGKAARAEDAAEGGLVAGDGPT